VVVGALVIAYVIQLRRSGLSISVGVDAADTGHGDRLLVNK